LKVKAYHERIISSPVDDEAAILDLFNSIKTTDPEAVFSMINVYKELPISSEGKLFDVKNKKAEFKASQIQLAAIDYCKETIIQTPYLSMSIIGKLVYVDFTHQLVSLGEFAYADVHFDKRNAVRVRLKIPVNVTLKVDEKKISGVIHDISLGGCRLTTIVGSLFEQAKSISLHLKLLHKNQILQADIPSKVLRIEGGPQFKCAVQFTHTAESEKLLSMFIYQRQLEIIRELKEKC
jgi:hypothetical protein